VYLFVFVDLRTDIISLDSINS